MRSLLLVILVLAFLIAIVRLARLGVSESGQRALAHARFSRGGARAVRAAMALAVLAAVALWVFTAGSAWGTLGSVFVPVLARVGAGYWVARSRGQLRVSGLAYFHALRGLVHSGLGLPAALFQLAQADPTPFARAMLRSLDGFETGKSLTACLEGVQRQVPNALLGACLTGLQSAYRQGYAVAPLLDRVVPLLEAELEASRRQTDLFRSAAAQAAFAFCLPWILKASFWFFAHPQEDPAGLLVGVLVAEAAGVWLLWKLSSFY